jgi:hypothetical protein
MSDLDQFSAVELTLDERRYRFRTELTGHAGAAFAAAGVRPPRCVTPLDEVAQAENANL